MLDEPRQVVRVVERRVRRRPRPFAVAMPALIECEQPKLWRGRARDRIPPPRIRGVAMKQHNRPRRIGIPLQVMQARNAFEKMAMRRRHFRSLRKSLRVAITATGLSSIA